MLRIIEQRYLLIMLKNNREYPNSIKKGNKINPYRPHNFYRVMRSMVNKKLVKISNNNGIKIYKLTEYGWAIASCIAKDPDTPKNFKKYARDVEIWIT